jgi:probable phosphoglycerate mutase
MASSTPRIYVARHGETEWALSGRHTGRTDIPLTDRGRRNAEMLGKRLAGMRFGLVLTSPLSRASETCRLAGLGASAVVEPDLAEWDYGAYEGLKSVEIHEERPDWILFRDGCPDGESPDAIGARADRVVAKLRDAAGDAIVFSHGHMIRVLAARWLGLPAGDARYFLCGTASLGILAFEHGSLTEPVVSLWNDDRHLRES